MIPVLCIGNFVVGGAGKTPLAIALYERLEKLGKKVVFLTRGYGGESKGPRLVDRMKDTAKLVGDEPLLLADRAETVVSADRLAGVNYIEKHLEADVILMDDGFQSAKVKPVHAMLVIDTMRGLGNGHILPAGPLRARLSTQIAHADSLFIIRSGDAEAVSTHNVIDTFKKVGKPVFEARVLPVSKGQAAENKEPVIAFSGIAHPPKFFQSLRQSGINIVEEVSFPDHHFFTQKDAADLIEKAKRHKAGLMTTAKDAIRLKGGEGVLKKLAGQLQIFEVELVFEDTQAIDGLLKAISNN